MTREEAIKYLIKPVATSTKIGEEKQKEFEAYNMAIKTLEQEPTTDRIEYGTDGNAYRLTISNGKEFKQEPKTDWIPIGERLPEEREWYLAVFKEKDTGFQLIPRVDDYIGENNWRIIDEDGLCKEYRDILECVAWMPLPELYKEEVRKVNEK